MTIREVILPEERAKVVEFLASFGLGYESNGEQTIYAEENDRIVGTVSSAGYVIKCLAVAQDMQSENLAVTLVSEIIKRLASADVFYYQVFTKPQYKPVFQSLGFTPLVETDKVCFLEGGDGNINNELKALATRLTYNLDIDVSAQNDIACVVLNGNPFTEGHLYLVEKAASEHDYCVVFVLEEEGSMFTFKERNALAFLACRPLKNVVVVPSTKYIVSRSTFPGYFLKTQDETTRQYAKFDAMIFAQYFMPYLGISTRYVGTETVDYMQTYNQTLSEVLGDKLVLVERKKIDGQVVSAKHVRALLADGKILEAAQLVPTAVRAMFVAMVSEKNV